MIDFSNGVVEVLGVLVKSLNLLLIVVQQPDDTIGGHRSTHIQFKEAITEVKSYLRRLSSPLPDIMLCGDFNLPHACWPEGSVRSGCSDDER